MNTHRRPSGDQPRRPSGRRDLLVLSLIALAVFGLGVASGLFSRLNHWLQQSRFVAPEDDLLAILALLSVALAVFSIRRWRQASQEISLREETERRYQSMVERVPAVAYVRNAADVLGVTPPAYVSPQLERLLGHSAEEWLGDPALWDRCAMPGDREAVKQAWENSVRQGKPFTAEYRMIRRDGGVIWVRDEAVPVSTGSRGRPIYQGVMFDITERRRAEDHLRDAEERYRTLVERLPVAVYIDAVDELSTAVYISPQYERLTGYSPEERLAQPDLWVRLLHPHDREWVLAESARTNETGDPFDVEHRIVTRDGRTLWVHDTARLVQMPGGERVWQGVLTDITEQRLAQESLSRRDRILEAVGHAAERFLGASSWTDAMEDVLERLGIAGGASRVAVYRHENDERGRACVGIVREWTGPGVEPMTPVIGDRLVPLEEVGLGRWVEAFDRGEAIHGVTRDLPGGERVALERAGVRAIVVIPIQAGGKRWGHLVCDQTEVERVWHQAELDALQVVAKTLGAAIGREDAARRLSEAEERYRRLVEQIPAVTYTWTWRGDEYIVVYASPQIEDILGYTRAEWTARPTAWYDWIHADDRHAVIAENKRCETTGESNSMEYRMIRKDGRVIWVEDSWVVVDDAGPRAFQGVVFDVTTRREAEEQLREAEERYRTLVEQIPAITYVDEWPGGDDADTWPTVYISPQVQAILGYSPEEWTANAVLWTSLIHPDDRERALEADRRHYETGEPLATELRVLAKDGSVHWLRDEAMVIRDERSGARWSQGIMLDITERKLAEQHLHEAEERYRNLIETIPAATYIDTVDAVSKAVYMSPQVEQIFGYTPEEWIAQPELWEQGLHPDDHDEVVARVARLNVEGVPYEAEYRFRRPDGRTVWVQDQAVIIRDGQGNPRFCQGVMFDITERRESEEQLLEAEERFRAIVEHIPAAIYLDKPDVSMQSLYASPQIEEITGVPQQDWIRSPDAWIESIHPEDRTGVLDRYTEAVSSGQPWSDEYRMNTRDGRTIWVHDETTFLHDERGEHSLMLGVISDITERKLAEQALRESEQREREAAERLRALDEMKNTFLAAVSHELRSPLTSILGLSLTLERSELPEDDRNDLLERLAANARKLDRLLKDLLDIDRLNRGIVEPQYRVTDVGALARRAIESLDSLADRSVQVHADPVVLSVDPAKVERIVENLLMNAARHTTVDRTIWLLVKARDDGVLIAVEDDGQGVPEDLREAIFEPFRQGPGASSHSPGTGIGLSLVARFAQLHGGRAWVEEREGGGASFRVFIPGGTSGTAADGSAATVAPIVAQDEPVGQAEAG